MIIGIALIFSGFLLFGILGDSFQMANIEMNEFGDCHDYSDDTEPVPINCSYKVFDQTLFFAAVVGLIIAGIISLVKAAKGDWDSKVKPEDMAGPNDQNTEKED
ncbi:hypothetical protein NsoK4_03295 [Nitrosopumilus sp. K4]|nr:hypothetical protein NsoK4_03295 [Nitrosopumilus sp. K4]